MVPYLLLGEVRIYRADHHHLPHHQSRGCSIFFARRERVIVLKCPSISIGLSLYISTPVLK